MRSVLVVTPNLSDLDLFREDLAKLNVEEILAVRTSSEARRILIDRVYDLLVINAPLSDENGVRLAVDVIGNNQSLQVCRTRSAETCFFFCSNS